jgi:protein gp37
MGDKSKIEWTEATWNPIRGCSRVSEGCRNCYAEAVAARFSGPGQPYEGLAKMTSHGPRWTGQVRVVKEHLFDPLQWRSPRRVFVNSMSDLFHEKLAGLHMDQVFAVMAMAPQHTFQVLTKRPERMRQYVNDQDASRRLGSALRSLALVWPKRCLAAAAYAIESIEWPLPNVWLGVSVEDQAAADERIPLLLRTPAAVRFLSCEPLLGPIDFHSMTTDPPNSGFALTDGLGCFDGEPPAGIDWVIVGGESGPHARPMHPDWARQIRDQCVAVGVPFFFKQWGEWVVPFDSAETGERACVVCGCTEEYACPGGCYWASCDREDNADMEDRCSQCVGKPLPAYRAVKFHRVGKKAAGRELDGRTWDEYPRKVMANI